MSKDPNTLDRLKAFWSFICSGEPVVVPPPPKFSTWKTIKLGTGLSTADDFRTALKESGNRINDWGIEILNNPAFTARETEEVLDLVVVSVTDHWFKGVHYRWKFIDKALELGLRLCPAEVGPQLRLQYADQPEGEWLVIGMEPIIGEGGFPGVFSVEHGEFGPRWLRGTRGFDYDSLPDRYRYVFVRPKSHLELGPLGL